MRKLVMVALWGACLSYSSSAAAQRVQLELIGNASSANDMSPDGRYIVGSSADGLYHWDTWTDTWTILPTYRYDDPESGEGLSAAAVSDDGTVVVGDMLNPDPPDPNSPSYGNVAGMWTTSTQSWTSLGHLPNSLNCPSKSDSYEISADGSVVVGLSWDGCSGRGFRWTEEAGMVELEPLANGSNRASVVSADGNVIGGFAQGSFSRTPAIWDGTTAAGQLLDPPNGDALGEVHGIRDDGSVLLGEWNGDAVSWTESGGSWIREQIGSGSFRPGWTGIPLDIADNDTVVGFDINQTVRRGWIVLNDGTMKELGRFVTDGGGELPLVNGAPIVPEVPQAISTNGHIIIGHGIGSGPFFSRVWRILIYSECDFDSDFDCDLDDIDALIGAIAAGSVDELFDLTGDGAVDLADRDAWLAQAGAENLDSGGAYIVADANLDGVVDVSDFNLWNASKFQTGAAWSLGDFNADGSTDVSDFNLWNENKFQSADLQAVPEPVASPVLLLLAAVSSWGLRRRCA